MGRPLFLSRVRNDGRSMFRAVVRAIAYNERVRPLEEGEERLLADSLREVTCNGLSANAAYTADNCAASEQGGTIRYVHRMSHPATAANECELFVLANLLGLYVELYVARENGLGYRCKAVHGIRGDKKPIRLLRSTDHRGCARFDVLLPQPEWMMKTGHIISQSMALTANKT